MAQTRRRIENLAGGRPGRGVLIWGWRPRLSGDEFGRLEGAPFFELASRDGRACPRAIDLPRAGSVARGSPGRTSRPGDREDRSGNLAKMLVSPGLRKLKPSEKDGPLVPVLVMERFETIDAGDRRSFKARGKELTLFDGFQFDLDAGQVVPEGLGRRHRFLDPSPGRPAPGGTRMGLDSYAGKAASLPCPGAGQTVERASRRAGRLRRPL